DQAPNDTALREALAAARAHDYSSTAWTHVYERPLRNVMGEKAVGLALTRLKRGLEDLDDSFTIRPGEVALAMQDLRVDIKAAGWPEHEEDRDETSQAVATSFGKATTAAYTYRNVPTPENLRNLVNAVASLAPLFSDPR